ncbi:MAG: shikimate kinase AroK [Pseudomonadota bacterium]
MKTPTKIFLIGPMGAGKSTIGKQLAAALKLAFVDSDAEIQQRTGVDIPTIFEFEGEEGFRKREAAVIEELTQQDQLVLATGGGAVLDAGNRRNLAARGFVIYLQCSTQQQFERTAKDKNRPLLDADDPMAALDQLMEVRAPLYNEISDLVISTEQRGASGVVREIIARIESL